MGLCVGYRKQKFYFGDEGFISVKLCKGSAICAQVQQLNGSNASYTNPTVESNVRSSMCPKQDL